MKTWMKTATGLVGTIHLYVLNLGTFTPVLHRYGVIIVSTCTVDDTKCTCGRYPEESERMRLLAIVDIYMYQLLSDLCEYIPVLNV